MDRKNEAKTDLDLYNFIKDNRRYSKPWMVKKTTNRYVQDRLDISSKSGKGFRGEPDLIYVNEKRRLLILVENKPHIQYHISKNENNPKSYAVDGIKHYLSYFTKEKLATAKETVQKYFENWAVVGIAFSGDIHDQYNHLVSTFIVAQGEVKNIETAEILDEEDYIAFFENIDLETISRNISRSSREINRMLRTLDSQKRPVLLSGLMICLYERDGFANDFKKSYSQWSVANIIRNIPTTISDILHNEGIDADKINVLINELSFITTDHDLNDTDILRQILTELEDNVIPLFNKKANYDILGKFYEEFLRYAGVANVKKGIVLTPGHITKLFTDVITFKTNDVILDTCCGTGAFLIAGMNKLVAEIEGSNISGKKEKISSLKQKQLVGFEKSTTMYSLAISNMLFRGDGKSRIFNIDTFSPAADRILAQLHSEGIRPSIGFINPPFGGKDNSSNPTKKEIQFVEKLLDNVSRYGVVIAPLSTYFKDDVERNRILSKHTLKCVINMPGELFQPNASALTAIGVFETHIPHNGKPVVFYNLEDDGLVLSKHRGRTDILNKWNFIKKEMLEKLRKPEIHEDGMTLVRTSIGRDDEWIIQAHSKTDYSKLTHRNFVNAIKQYVIFGIKLKLNLLTRPIDEITLLEILQDNLAGYTRKKNVEEVNTTRWKEFALRDLFDIRKGKRLTVEEFTEGPTPFIGAIDSNNGYREFIGQEPIHRENTITVTYNGSVAEAFYQPRPFWASDDVNVLYAKFDMNIYTALFIAAVIRLEKFRFNYGRKWNLERMNESKIKLPVDKKGNPDLAYMEKYMKSLPYAEFV